MLEVVCPQGSAKNIFNVYLFLREKEYEQGRGRERDGDSREPDVGLHHDLIVT